MGPALDPVIAFAVFQACLDGLAFDVERARSFRAVLASEGVRLGSARERDAAQPIEADRHAAEVAAWHGPRRRLACEVG